MKRGTRKKYVQVLEVTTGELVVSGDLDLALTLLLDNDVVTKVVGAALDLDAVLEELLEGSDIEDLVAGRLRSIDDVLRLVSDWCSRGRIGVKIVIVSSSLNSSSIQFDFCSLSSIRIAYLLGLLLGLARLLLLKMTLAYCILWTAPLQRESA
jgi:hypothetical protein